MDKIEEKSIIFKNNREKNLWGVLTLPQGKGKIPAVIIAHGFGATKSRRRFVDLGREFARHGVAVLRFDFSGCGDSEGDFQNISIVQQVKDLKAAYNFLTKQDRVDKKRIGLLGESLGGLITCLFQTEKPVAKALVLVAPALDQENLTKIWNTPQQIRKWQKQGYLDTPKGRIGVQYLKEAKDYTKVAPSIKAPTLIIQGKEDEDVPVKFSLRVLEVLGGEKRIVMVREADHKFDSYQASKKLVDFSLKWFEKYL